MTSAVENEQIKKKSKLSLPVASLITPAPTIIGKTAYVTKVIAIAKSVPKGIA